VLRSFGMILLALAAGIIPAAGAYAAPRLSTPASAQEHFGVRLVDVPLYERGNQRALRYIVDYLPVGSVIHRRILIVNEQPDVAHLTVYPDAAKITNGQFVGDEGETPSGLTTWISVAHPVLTLAPHQQVMDMVTIKVPPGATAGEQYGVIWAQEAAAARSHKGFAILEVDRVGIRVYLAVGRGGAPPTSFRIMSVTGTKLKDGRPVIVAHVDNTGERAIDLSGTASLTGGPGGASAGPYTEQAIMTFAPGQSGNITFLAGNGLSDGPWQASVSLVSGFTKATLVATIDFGGKPAALSLSSAMYLGLGIPLVGLVIAGAVGWQTFRRRRAYA